MLTLSAQEAEKQFGKLLEDEILAKMASDAEAEGMASREEVAEAMGWVLP